MAVKYFGKLIFKQLKDEWEMHDVAPHVCIKLKSIFPKIPKTQVSPFTFQNTTENCHDILWFIDRYPFDIDKTDLQILKSGRKKHLATAQRLEEIFVPDYKPKPIELKDGFAAREYQLKVADFDRLQKRFLLGDDIGLGKTLEAILTLFNEKKLPAIIVVQTHLPKQWKEDGIEKFTNLSCHIIKGTRPYTLPPADVYIIKYSCLAGWVNIFETGFFKSAVFDECQELRISGSGKYGGARALSDSVEYCIGMSYTPVYNFGDEIFNVLNLIKPGCLGEFNDFIREWAVPHGQNHYKVKDPQALGAYLRDNYLLLRRTKKEVGRELPPINTIVYTVGYDSSEVKKSEEIAKQLALKVVGGSFVERGQAARELDAFMRHQTGVAKAKEVAAFVRIILESGEPVLLSGWHRSVYDVWLNELKDFNPVMYTGSESPSQKEKAKQAFISGESKVFIISNRSGIGLDGLQHVCKNVVIGELDWSPQVHGQIIGRVDRDGNKNQTTVYYPVCDFGSDPFIINLLGLKSSQAHGIMNPLEAIPDQFSDESRIKAFAESFLNKK